jgi:hypothetical protein
MIVSRWIWTVKNRDDTLAQWKFVRERFWAPDVVRIYASIEGAPSNVLVWEEEHENMAEYERRSSERRSDPDWDALVASRFPELLIEAHHEVWEAVIKERNNDNRTLDVEGEARMQGQGDRVSQGVCRGDWLDTPRLFLCVWPLRHS